MGSNGSKQAEERREAAKLKPGDPIFAIKESATVVKGDGEEGDEYRAVPRSNGTAASGKFVMTVHSKVPREDVLYVRRGPSRLPGEEKSGE